MKLLLNFVIGDNSFVSAGGSIVAASISVLRVRVTGNTTLLTRGSESLVEKELEWYRVEHYLIGVVTRAVARNEKALANAACTHAGSFTVLKVRQAKEMKEETRRAYISGALNVRTPTQRGRDCCHCCSGHSQSHKER